MTYVSQNARFRRLAIAQGPLTDHPVLPWFSGTTGGSVSYGWRHDHMLNATWIKEVIQCYAARPIYYDGAPTRHSGYYSGGRPKGWTDTAFDDDTNLFVDMPNGEVRYHYDGTNTFISGPDLEHFPLSPLIAVYDNPAIHTASGYGFSNEAAAEQAGIMLRYLGRAHAGMLRQDDGQPSSYVCSHRSASYVLRTVVDLGKRGLIDTPDAVLLLAYIEGTLLPSWLGPIAWQSGGKGGPGQVYNGVYWLLPAMHDLAVATPPGLLRRALADARDLMARQVSWLEALVPGRGCQVEKVATWDYSLTAAGITTQPYWGPWGVRAMHVAGTVLGNQQCINAAKAEAFKWRQDPTVKQWLVGAGKEWL